MISHLNSTPQPPKRAVIIGSAGFVGSAIVKRLQGDNIPTLSLSRAELDLLSPEASNILAGLLKPTDAVVAVAAIAPVKSARMLSDNMRLVANVVEALGRAKVAHVINISSDAVYADGPLPLTEQSPMTPGSLHGAMHLARELAFGAEANVPLIHLRPTLIYGSSDPHNGYGPNRFRRLADAGEDIVLFGEGEERRDHVHVDDVAELIFQALLHKSVGALNVVTGQVHSFADIAKAVVAMSGKQIPIRISPRIGAMPHNGYRPFDNTACKSAYPQFNFTPLQDGLRRAALRL
ncbi:NAD-dependent dehydratase [Tardiphaga robiniae]|jgi:nucleoside-diphosphate-sugar epimerase|uniref:NAD-dependent dehydratase n=2 Tax=Tardiphaga robiniae TaxID=943830 RepID=A0A161QXP1_9BRAD|nr:NAD-dependent dehydratase [Tardiphaga robiniae]